MRLGLAAELADEGDPELMVVLDEMGEELDVALAELRTVAHGIHPPLLARSGLPAALEQVGRRSGFQIRIEHEGIGRYSEEIEIAVYLSCVEALQNVAKHAGKGAGVDLRLWEQERSLRFVVEDDGRGFVASAESRRGAGQREHGRPPGLGRRHDRGDVDSDAGHDCSRAGAADRPVACQQRRSRVGDDPRMLSDVAFGATGTSVKVVVADDNAGMRGAIRAVVGRAGGFELVGEAASGGELLELVSELRPDVAVIDVRMASIDGIEASHRIATLHPETVVILVTAGDVDALPPAADACPAAAKLNKAELTTRRLAQIWSDHGVPARAR